MKKIIIPVFILTFGVVLGLYLVSGQTNKGQEKEESPRISNQAEVREESVDLRAGFAIFTRRTFRVFTAPKYHNLSEDVFIRADNPNIVHVKKRGVTWGDFFKTLPMKLTSDCLTTGTGETFCSTLQEKLKFYLNGEMVNDFLLREIKDDERALISFGSEGEEAIRNQFQRVIDPY